MTYRILQPAMLLALLTLVPWATAQAAVDKAVEDKLRAALDKPAIGLTVATVKTSEIAGLYEVQFTSGPVVYATAKGDYMILGDLFSVGPDGIVNLAEQRRDGERAEQLAAVAEKDMIIFPPEGEVKAHVTVFTDISCFYCQKFHKEVPELNKRGVEVRYLAYPRSGLDSPGYRQLATAWCAADRQNTLTRLKMKKPVPDSVCDDNPIASQYALGQQLGVRGTPALITDQGQMIPGYQSADDLMVTLGLE